MLPREWDGKPCVVNVYADGSVSPPMARVFNAWWAPLFGKPIYRVRVRHKKRVLA